MLVGTGDALDSDRRVTVIPYGQGQGATCIQTSGNSFCGGSGRSTGEPLSVHVERVGFTDM